MKRLILAVLIFAAITLMLADTKKEIIAFTPRQVRWFSPSYYTDGRERAQLLGDSTQGGAWVDAGLVCGQVVDANYVKQKS